MQRQIIRKGGVILPIFLFFIILLSISALGVNEYTRLGEDNFKQATGLWNSGQTNDCLNTTGITCSSRALSSPEYVPLVADLDDDGANEIIVLDGTAIKLYENSDLDIVDTLVLSFTPVYMIAYDIDGDNYTEIIASGASSLVITEYNGTSFHNQSSFNLPAVSQGTPHIILGCAGTNNCLVARESRQSGGTPGSGSILVSKFNSSQITISSSVHTSANNLPACFSHNPIMEIKDYDGDGINEFIFSIGDPNGDKLLIKYIDSENISSMQTDRTITNTDADFTGLNCGENGLSGRFTNPLVANLDGAPGNNMETIIGYMIDSDEFNMKSYYKTGGVISTHPDIFDADGVLISNLFLADAFEDTGKVDFCVLGYDAPDNEIDLLCSSLETQETQGDREHTYSTATDVNITGGYFLAVHSSQQYTKDSTSPKGEVSDLDEIITPYGVFSMDWSSDLTGGSLTLEWDNPKTEAFVSAVDVEGTGLSDLLLLTSTRLWYINDNFENSNAILQRLRTNPSISYTIRTNETVSVEIYCYDADGDSVQAKITSYEGESNEQDSGWSSDFTSGSSVALTFEANKTTALSNLIIQCRDNANFNASTNTSYTFSVSPNGIQVGDAIFDTGDIEEETEEEADETELEEQAEGFFSGFGLDLNSAGKAVIWLVLMLYAGVVLGSHNVNPAGILVGEMGMLLIGSMIGFVPGWISAVVAISSLGLGMIYLFGNRGNGVS